MAVDDDDELTVGTEEEELKDARTRDPGGHNSVDPRHEEVYPPMCAVEHITLAIQMVSMTRTDGRRRRRSRTVPTEPVPQSHGKHEPRGRYSQS